MDSSWHLSAGFNSTRSRNVCRFNWTQNDDATHNLTLKTVISVRVTSCQRALWYGCIFCPTSACENIFTNSRSDVKLSFRIIRKLSCLQVMKLNFTLRLKTVMNELWSVHFTSGLDMLTIFSGSNGPQNSDYKNVDIFRYSRPTFRLNTGNLIFLNSNVLHCAVAYIREQAGA